MPPRKRLGALLIELGLIDEHQLNSALGHQKKWGGKLGDILVQEGLCREEQILHALSVHFNIPIVQLEGITVEPRVLKLVSKQVAEKFRVFPLEMVGAGRAEVLTVAMAEPTDLSIVDQLAFHTSRRVKPVLTAESEIAAAIDRFYGDGARAASLRAAAPSAAATDSQLRYAPPTQPPPARPAQPDSSAQPPSEETAASDPMPGLEPLASQANPEAEERAPALQESAPANSWAQAPSPPPARALSWDDPIAVPSDVPRAAWDAEPAAEAPGEPPAELSPEPEPVFVAADAPLEAAPAAPAEPAAPAAPPSEPPAAESAPVAENPFGEAQDWSDAEPAAETPEASDELPADAILGTADELEAPAARDAEPAAHASEPGAEAPDAWAEVADPLAASGAHEIDPFAPVADEAGPAPALREDAAPLPLEEAAPAQLEDAAPGIEADPQGEPFELSAADALEPESAGLFEEETLAQIDIQFSEPPAPQPEAAAETPAELNATPPSVAEVAPPQPEIPVEASSAEPLALVEVADIEFDADELAPDEEPAAAAPDAHAAPAPVPAAVEPSADPLFAPQEMEPEAEPTESLRAADELPEELHAGDELPEELHAGDELPEELHAGDELPEELHADDALPEELRAGDELPEELHAGDALPEELHAAGELRDEPSGLDPLHELAAQSVEERLSPSTAAPVEPYDEEREIAQSYAEELTPASEPAAALEQAGPSERAEDETPASFEQNEPLAEFVESPAQVDPAEPAGWSDLPPVPPLAGWVEESTDEAPPESFEPHQEPPPDAPHSWLGQELGETTPLSPYDVETLAGVGIDPADGAGALRLLAGLLRALSARQLIDLGELTVDLYAQRQDGAAQARAAAEAHASELEADPRFAEPDTHE